ncbi:ABC transporter ATP-binding protein [Pseudonocardia nigra]|uniref:ABC transporter ATP-binding protein n=1 Tax=Pseudonocardia nigra TaxID=1921578 RepID=UPI001C5FE2AC|nr:ABC transporter ATP-binding protein [Pseudonocardia nigra]
MASETSTADAMVSDTPAVPGPRPRDLVLEHVEVTYEGVFLAAHGVNLRVPAGKIIGLLGSNGAGKTTTLRAISGFLRSERAAVSNGTISYGEGVRLVGRSPHWVARQGIVVVPERDKVFAGLSVAENLKIGSAGTRNRTGKRERLEVIYGYFPILRERGTQKAGYLSGGERQMLGIARALMRRPSLLMIDELSLGLAPKIIEDLLEIMTRINEEQGTSILVVEQNAAATLDVSDFVYIMESGRIVLEGTPGELRDRADVQEFYLGMGGQEVRSYGEVRPHRKAARWWG